MQVIDQLASVARPSSRFWPAGLGAQVALFLALAFAARLSLDFIAALAGWGQNTLFGPADDIFADSLKQSLAVRAVSAPLLTDTKVLHWPLLFRHYLFFNDYIRMGNMQDAQPPVAMLQMMATAKVMVLADPMTALAVQFIAYLYGVLLLKTLLNRLCAPREALWLASPMLCAYPVLNMLDRGNFHAGYASLGVILYMLSAYSGKWRGWGMFALCCAINLRPNLAPLLLLEFAVHADPWRALRVIALLAAASLAMALAALAAAHAVDPSYTPAAFLHALGVFHEHYIVQDGGLYGNQSLYGAVRCIWSMFVAVPAYNQFAVDAVTGLAAACAAGFCGLAVSGRMTRAEAIFLAFALTTLFSPWNAEYHLIRVLGPLLVLCCEFQSRDARLDWRPIPPVLGLLLLSGLISWRWPDAASALLLLATTAAASAVLWVRAHRVEGLSPGEVMMFWTCLLLLCPVGDGRGNPIELSFLVLAASAGVAWNCARRPAVWLGAKLGYKRDHGYHLQR